MKSQIQKEFNKFIKEKCPWLLGIRVFSVLMFMASILATIVYYLVEEKLSVNFILVGVGFLIIAYLLGLIAKRKFRNLNK